MFRLEPGPRQIKHTPKVVFIGQDCKEHSVHLHHWLSEAFTGTLEIGMSFQCPSEEKEFLHLEKRRPSRGWVELGRFAGSLDPEL